MRLWLNVKQLDLKQEAINKVICNSSETGKCLNAPKVKLSEHHDCREENKMITFLK